MQTDRTLEVDEIMDMDEETLMSMMDRVQPRWMAKYADRQELEQWYAADNKELGERRVRLNALRNLKDALWLIGHSASCVKYSEKSDA